MSERGSVPSEIASYRAFIDGDWHEAASGRRFDSIDPSTGQVWANLPRCDATDVSKAARAALRAAREGPWSRMRASERGRWLGRLGDAIASATERLAEVESRDNGKRLSEVRTQLADLPEFFHYFGGLADKIQGSVVPIDRADTFNFTSWEPCGVVGAITAWNSPLALLAWKVAPALAAGNSVVIKPSEHASASTLVLMDVLATTGLPSGVLNAVTGFGEEAGEPLVTDPAIAHLSFTGSARVGRRIAALAGAHLKRVTLELGGKSAQLVFPDADLEQAMRGVISGIFVSNGQTCVAGSRLFLHEAIHDEFVAQLAERVAPLRFGHPGESSTQIGPIANAPQFERIERMVSTARAEGARCVLGGAPVPLPSGGWCYAPTILVDVDPGMEIAREEVFGPVLAVMRFQDEAEALALANASSYGLAAGLWTRDLSRAIRLSASLQAGTVYVNTYRGVAPQSPCGGYKDSGWGRENGVEAIREFLQLKSVWVGTGEMPDPFPPNATGAVPTAGAAPVSTIDLARQP